MTPDQILALSEKRMKLVNNADFIMEQADKAGRPTTEDEQKTIRSLLADADETSAEIKKMEADEGLRKQVKDSLGRLSELQQRRVAGFIEPVTMHGDTPYAKRNFPRSFTRSGRLGAFRNTRDGEEAAYVAGMFGLAVFYHNPKAQRWCQENGIQYRAHQEGTDSLGGATVPDEVSNAIINLRDLFGDFRAQTRVIPMGSDVAKIPKKTVPLAMVFAAESAAGAEQTSTWAQVTLTAQKGKVHTRLSMELDQDAIINFGDFLVQDLGEAFALGEDRVGFNGDGSASDGSIDGIIDLIEAQTTFTSYVNAASGTDTIAGIVQADVINLMAGVAGFAKRANRPGGKGAKFYCSSSAFDVVFSALAASAGGNTINTLGGAVQQSYLGYPIVINDQWPTDTAAVLNNLGMIGFGDLSLSSTFGNRAGIAVSRSTEVYWATDEIGIKGVERFDIKNHDFGSATALGPFALLIGNT